MAFSFDGRFVAIAMAYNACLHNGSQSTAASVRIHAFDAASGVVDLEPAARFDDAGGRLAFPDLCTFLPSTSGRYVVLVSDQARDSIVSFEFDAGEGTLGYGGVFAADLPFVHGIDASADGRFVAITTLGDDRLHIARVPAALTTGRWAGPPTAR